MFKRCAEHGAQEVQLSNDAAWYEPRAHRHAPARAPPGGRARSSTAARSTAGPASHQQKVELPVVTITSACNLDCPICYVHNKNDDAFHMAVEDFQRILDHLVADHGGELDIINLTGGEPTLHPRLTEFLELARAAGVHRVTVCSNGIRLARDEALVERLARAGGAGGALVRHLRAGGRSGAAGRAAAGHQAALPGPAREARRRHHADPGDDPRRERPRDRARSSSWACSGRTSATSRSTR